MAKAKLGLDDDTYRRVLAKCAGVTSSTELDQAGFDAVMGFLDHVGLRPLVADGPSYGKRAGFASPGQVELIRTLWMDLHQACELDEAALCGWLLKWFKVSSLRFLTVAQAPKVITALKAWKSRARAA
ncbi:regulatory protein GemA [Paracoccaceae bacterium Fryx2]|nr:regulatory protein GemA [Paracoccaceae bacterium Fryx2]